MTDFDPDPDPEELKTAFCEAIPPADAVVCVAMEVTEDSSLDITAGRWLVDGETLTADEQLAIMLSMDDELQEMQFLNDDDGEMPTPVLVDSDELESMLDESADDDSDTDDFGFRGMFR